MKCKACSKELIGKEKLFCKSCSSKGKDAVKKCVMVIGGLALFALAIVVNKGKITDVIKDVSKDI